jgi:hypothetical protein
VNVAEGGGRLRAAHGEREATLVHVERVENLAKFWLDPVRLHETGGFRGAELNRVAALAA